MNMTRTQWFDGNVKPVHDGNYERTGTGLYKGTVFQSYSFHEGEWIYDKGGKDEMRAIHQNWKWRGLVHKPKDK